MGIRKGCLFKVSFGLHDSIAAASTQEKIMVTVASVLCSLSAAAALRAPVLPAQLASSSARSAVNMMAGKKIPDKNVWVPIVSASDAKPLTVTSGFQYGVEVAVVSGKGGNVYGLSNKLPPFGQPTTFATFDATKPDCIVEPVTARQADLWATHIRTGCAEGASAQEGQKRGGLDQCECKAAVLGRLLEG